jgi:large subunit ribosomal protein L25
MLALTAKKREKENPVDLRDKGILPAVLYGPKVKSQPIKVDFREFSDIYEQAGESTLISLDLEGKKHTVLLHDISRDPLSGNPIHVDFYQPILTEKVEATIPIVFEGESPAVKDLGGTLVEEIQEVEVKALPQNLPHELKVDVSSLKTFDDEILVKDLIVSQEVEILREPDKIVVNVLPPRDVEKELEQPAEEEKVEEVERVGEEEEEQPSSEDSQTGEEK